MSSIDTVLNEAEKMQSDSALLGLSAIPSLPEDETNVLSTNTLSSPDISTSRKSQESEHAVSLSTEESRPPPTGIPVPRSPRTVALSSASRSSRTSSHSPTRRHTAPEGMSPPLVPGALPPPGKITKRIILCCDGTWQNAISVNQRWRYTNVLKIARCLEHEDQRYQPPIPQIVFYQSGVGTEKYLVDKVMGGVAGAGLVEKVQAAYGFLAHNYAPGDEISIFGFSRGAYTARMVSAFIGEIGILSRKDMDSFADIFLAYQMRGKTKDAKKRAEYDARLAPFNSPDSYGKRRVDIDKDKFVVKILGVFDTVGSLGLPTEFSTSNEMKTVFDFPDNVLGPHVERALHAMALFEIRADFNVTKFHQTDLGKERGQVLKQCWFAGEHTDIGGGWADHDLSDVALAWMLANVEDVLSLDLAYIKSLPAPVAQWGEQKPHYPKSGIFRYGGTIRRSVEVENPRTNETIHSSVENQTVLSPDIAKILRIYPSVIPALLPLEEQIKQGWKYDPGELLTRPSVATAQMKMEMKSENKASKRLQRMMRAATDTIKFVAREREGLEINEDGSRKEDSALQRDTLVRRLGKKMRRKEDATL